MGSGSINYDGINYKINYDNDNFKIKYVNNYLAGLVGTRYVGYHNDDPSWFATATPHGDTNTLSMIDNFSSSPDLAQEEYYSWQWIGYFKPSTSEEYTFYTNSDDGSYLWIGESANGPTLGNVLVNNGGAHGAQETNGSINLVANTYYPIRIQFGEIGGGDIITVSFSSNTISKTTDGDGYYFHI
jgi:hypothetical protein